MKILIITDEAWNDKIHGNNVLTNWFEGFDAEFAQIYCSPGEPYNKCCKKYFQVTDTMMVRSIINRNSVGVVRCFKDVPYLDHTVINSGIELENKQLYSKLKSITTETLRAIRDLIWYFGKYDIEKLKEFINEFDPDIIFCPRLSSVKLLRFEKIVKQITYKPMVAFTGDDEYSLNQVNLSLVYWLRRFIKRRMMRKTVSIYDLYYTHSEEQGKEYSKIFKVPTKILLKCGEFSLNKVHTKVNYPIRVVYAGKLYCNRWKSLAAIGQALQEINCSETNIILEIYTKDKVSKKQQKMLNDGRNIFLRGAVTPEKLKDIYEGADIALHVESFDLKNKLLTKFSFSTKIIDCMASGCAVMAMCWEKQAGFAYLKKEDAAFTIGSKDEIYTVLKRIMENPDLVKVYAKNAINCGIRNHLKVKIQKMIFDDFSNIIKRY